MPDGALTQVNAGAAHYGDPAVEFAALESGVGVTDRSHVGRLRLRGADVLDLLDRLTTNKLETLEPGEGMPSVLTTSKGRVVDLLTLTAADDYLLCLTSPGRQEAVVEWIDFYTFAEDVTVEDASADTAQLSLAGPGAATLLEGLGVDVSGLPTFHSRAYALSNADVLVWHTLSVGTPTYEIIVPVAAATGVWEALTQAGAVPTGYQAREAYRVQHGMPVHAAEFGDDTNPLESRLKGAISFNKGCYIGQEVVARLNTYQKVQRRLMAVTFSGNAQIGDALKSTDGVAAGVVTSVAQVPGGGTLIGLALVRQEHAAPDATLLVADRDTTATLSEPAFALATEPVEA
jgi:folate-binding protein YgfZ